MANDSKQDVWGIAESCSLLHNLWIYNGTLKRLLSLGFPWHTVWKELKLPPPPHRMDDFGEHHFANSEGLCIDGGNAVMRMKAWTKDQQGLRVALILRAALYSKQVPCASHTASNPLILTTTLGEKGCHWPLPPWPGTAWAPAHPVTHPRSRQASQLPLSRSLHWILLSIINK